MWAHLRCKLALVPLWPLKERHSTNCLISLLKYFFFLLAATSMNLFEFIDMCTDNGHGTIMNMKNLLEHFHCQVDWLESS